MGVGGEGPGAGGAGAERLNSRTGGKCRGAEGKGMRGRGSGAVLPRRAGKGEPGRTPSVVGDPDGVAPPQSI